MPIMEHPLAKLCIDVLNYSKIDLSQKNNDQQTVIEMAYNVGDEELIEKFIQCFYKRHLLVPPREQNEMLSVQNPKSSSN